MRKLAASKATTRFNKVILWTAGEFEIDFNAASASSRTTITRGTTGLLMEAMRLMDESSRDAVKLPDCDERGDYNRQ